MNKNHVRLLASVLVLLSIPAHAQVLINWGTATNMSTDTNVAANGTAFDAATFYSTATTVNGVTFNPLTTAATFSSPDVGGLKDASGDITVLYTGGVIPPGSTYLAYAGGSANYNNVVSTLSYSFGTGSGSGTVTLSNLTLGQTYQVEVWAYDGNAGDHGNVSTQLSGSGGGLLNPSTSATSPEDGQYVIGTFTAAGTTESFNYGAATGTYSILNDVAVRNITAVPEPSTWALMLAGFACLALRQRRLRNQI